MVDIIAAPGGNVLPHSFFHAAPTDRHSKRRPARPAAYFWDKATQPDSVPDIIAPEINSTTDLTVPRLSRSAPSWCDVDEIAISDSEDEHLPCVTPTKKLKKRISFARVRRIAFRTFVPQAGGTKSGTVVSTEFVSKTHAPSQVEKGFAKRGIFTISSWKIKSKGNKVEVKKMVAVVKRITRFSPAEMLPKTWADYQERYANQEIDIEIPPLPPMESSTDGSLSILETKSYFAPKPRNESVRQLVINRLSVCGAQQFSASEEAAATAKARIELGDKLLEQGQEPKQLKTAWEHAFPKSSHAAQLAISESTAINYGVSDREIIPETLEQHPVFRKIVNRCREMFGAAIGLLQVSDDDRAIFLAESGLNGMREVEREVAFCSHTILNGRKGLTLLDTHKDWRFQNNPVVKNLGIRFYAGVPLMAPKFHGIAGCEEDDLPMGTLCIMDSTPRDAFGVADRKKLAYMAEYARREIEDWFVAKMANKMKALETGREMWHKQMKIAASLKNGEGTIGPQASSHSRSPTRNSSTGHRTPLRRAPSFGVLLSSKSDASTPPTSPSSSPLSSLKSSLRATVPTLPTENTLSVTPRVQTVFNLATQLISTTLELSLVYLIAVIPPIRTGELGQTQLLAGHNVPVPAPSLNTGLHLRALRAPEGGLLYQNPSTKEAEEAALQPKGPTSDLSEQGSSSPCYASAMLVAVGPASRSCRGGFVIGGFTTDPKRVFGREDVEFMKQFAHQLEKTTATIKL